MKRNKKSFLKKKRKIRKKEKAEVDIKGSSRNLIDTDAHL